MRALPLLSPLLSGHQALDIPSLASFQKHDEGIQSEIEVDDRLKTGNASYVARLFQNGDVSAKEYANLWQTSIERPTSIEQPLADTPRVTA